MTGRIALDAHNLLTAVEKAMKGRGEKGATAAQFLAELHSNGFDVVGVPAIEDHGPHGLKVAAD